VKGAIAAGDPQTAAAGGTILKMGGNAVDAAVAAAFTSFVAEPSIVNIGGGGIALVVDSHSDLRLVYDFFSTMPSGEITSTSDFHEVVIDFGAEQQPFYIGRASVAVPGVVAGLCALAVEQGTLPLATLLEPAIRLARNGALLSPALAYVYNILQPIFQDTSQLADIYLPAGHPVEVGERLVFSNLAATLERLGEEGPDLFYTGDVGKAIIVDQRANGGLLTAGDLAAYEVLHLSPLSIDYRGFTILVPPPSSSGGVLVAFALKLLATRQLNAMVHNSAAHLRLLAEIMRLTNVARRDWETHHELGENRIAWFLADDHVDRYRQRLDAILNGDAAPEQPTFAPGPNDTTHISVVDQNGLLVSVTTSAGENAGFVVGNTGVCLNNMLGEEDLHPNGFHQLPPGRRLSTMMTPVVVIHDNEPVLAIGSGGSNRIRSAILQVLSNFLDFDMSLSNAVNTDRIHFEADTLQVEGGIDSSVVAQLRTQGYHVNYWQGTNMFFGGAHAVALQDGQLTPAGDHRRGGSSEIVETGGSKPVP
jgi:gamma-glutamyltranspeptidase/glutathione hydrolase